MTRLFSLSRYFLNALIYKPAGRATGQLYFLGLQGRHDALATHF